MRKLIFAIVVMFLIIGTAGYFGHVKGKKNIIDVAEFDQRARILKMLESLDEIQRKFDEQKKLIEIQNKFIEDLLENRGLIVAEATAYSPFDDKNGLSSDGNTEQTSTGVSPGKHIVAVDPKMIPLGSRVHIFEQKDDVTIEPILINAISGDIGGNIKNKRIDIFKETFEEAIQFGRKQVLLYVEPGGESNADG